MLALRTHQGRSLELTPDTTISLQASNFLLADADDNGSYTLPFTVPRSVTNQQALDFPELLDHARGQARTLEQADLYDDGRHLLTGTLRLLRITATTYELSLSYGASAVMAKLKAVRLRDLELGGLRVWKRGGDLTQFRLQLMAHMNEVMASPGSYDYLFAPFSNNDALADNPENWPRFANFNSWQLAPNQQTGQLSGTFDVTTGYVTGYAQVPGLTASPFPDFYPFYKLCSCPLVKLRYLVYALLQELEIPLEEDFFDDETGQLVLLGAALAEDKLITSQARAAALGLGATDFWFRLGDVLPDLTGAELLRKLADTFFLDISVSPLGVLRLRRSQSLLTQPPALALTRAAVPGPEVDVSADVPHLATAYLSENDLYTSTRYQPVDPNQLGAPVATLADLPTVPDFTHEVRLVQALNAYYQHTDTAWTFYSDRLALPEFGAASAESNLVVTQGCELVLEVTAPDVYILPNPGGKWPDASLPTEPNAPVVRVPCFGQRAYAPAFNCLERSKALRLAFYRGMQPYQTASQGSYPMLSAGTRGLQGQVLGAYSLRLDGEDGTVARFGAAVLPLRACPYTVSWPVWLSEEQFYQLDLARRVEIDGLHFAIRKVSVSFPLRQPAQLDLVLMPPLLQLQPWQQ